MRIDASQRFQRRDQRRSVAFLSRFKSIFDREFGIVVEFELIGKLLRRRFVDVLDVAEVGQSGKERVAFLRGRDLEPLAQRNGVVDVLRKTLVVEVVDRV